MGFLILTMLNKYVLNKKKLKEVDLSYKISNKMRKKENLIKINFNNSNKLNIKRNLLQISLMKSLIKMYNIKFKILLK